MPDSSVGDAEFSGGGSEPTERRPAPNRVAVAELLPSTVARTDRAFQHADSAVVSRLGVEESAYKVESDAK